MRLCYNYYQNDLILNHLGCDSLYGLGYSKISNIGEPIALYAHNWELIFPRNSYNQRAWNCYHLGLKRGTCIDSVREDFYTVYVTYVNGFTVQSDDLSHVSGRCMEGEYFLYTHVANRHHNIKRRRVVHLKWAIRTNKQQFTIISTCKAGYGKS